MTRGGDRRDYSHSCDCVCAAWGCQRPAPLRAAGSGALSDQSALSRRCSTPLRNFHLFECIPGTTRLFPLSLGLSRSQFLSLSAVWSVSVSLHTPLSGLGSLDSRRARAFVLYDYTLRLRFCFSHVYLSGSDRSETASSLSHPQPYTADPGSLSLCSRHRETPPTQYKRRTRARRSRRAPSRMYTRPPRRAARAGPRRPRQPRGSRRWPLGGALHRAHAVRAHR